MIICEVISRLIQNIILFFFRLFIKRDVNYIAIGSWSGERYVDNSRYLAEYINDEYTNKTVIWIGKKEIQDVVHFFLPRAIFLEKDKLRTNIMLLKCKYFFFSQTHYVDISKYSVYKNAILCYLHHGMPIKKWGEDGLNTGADNNTIVNKLYKWYTGYYLKYDYFITSSSLHDATNCTALKNHGCRLDKNIHSGTPRNDFLLNLSNAISDYKKAYCIDYGFDSSCNVILYAPTFRRKSTSIFSFFALTDEQNNYLERILEEYNACIIEKNHAADNNVVEFCSKSKRIISANKKANIQEILTFTDVLISDYSGVFLDYVLLDKPIIHHVYDYEYYKNIDSGLYYELDDFSAGEITHTFFELCDAIKSTLSGCDGYSSKRKYVREKYMTYEKGHASQIITKIVFGGKS